MKLTLFIFSTFFFLAISHGQSRDEILAEAYLLYHSEKASWHGTDIFLKNFPEKKKDIGGYLSYSEGDLHSCIFFDRAENPHLLAKITFDNDFNLQKIKIDTLKRKLNKNEMDLFAIRKVAVQEIRTDPFFKKYEHMNLNPVPIINGRDKKVFVLTGPEVTGVVVLGNDYVLTFGKNNKLKSKKALHKNIIPIQYDDTMKNAVTMHSHVKSTGKYITSTDICTLLLYEKYASWKQHIVISKKKVSIWNCETDQLLIMTRKAWEKIGKE